MKKTFFGKKFMASMAAVLMMLTVTSASAKETFIYGESDNGLIVSTLNEDGKTLTPKWKYEYCYDTLGTMTEKKAFRWNSEQRTWEPAYLLTIASDSSMCIMNYAEWDKAHSTFERNRQQSVYCTDSTDMLLTYYTISPVREISDNF